MTQSDVPRGGLDGWLDISNNQRVRYYVRGNLHGLPVVVFHGGPGYYVTASDFRLLDLNMCCVVLFDQRGCGQSIPAAHEAPLGFYADLTLDTLVDDAEAIRRVVCPGRRWCLAGWSWGSAVALRYATKFPQWTANILLQGVYTGTKEEHSHLFQRRADRDANVARQLSLAKQLLWTSMERLGVLQCLPAQQQPHGADHLTQGGPLHSIDPLLLHETLRTFALSFASLPPDLVDKNGRRVFRRPQVPCTCSLTERNACCIERLHRMASLWSLYENFMTYPAEREYYWAKMEQAARTDVPHRASHKDFTGALMQWILFTQRMKCRHCLTTRESLSRIHWGKPTQMWIVHGTNDAVCPEWAARVLLRCCLALPRAHLRVHQVRVEASHDVGDGGPMESAVCRAAESMCTSALSSWLEE